MTDIRLLEIFGQEWLDIIPKIGEYITPVENTLKAELAIGIKLYPHRENVFRVFKETKPKQINVIWLGQDPYHSPEGQATGRAFECGKYPSPSWRNIAQVYKKEVEGYDPLVVQGILDKWAGSGVFLLNKALTVREKMPNSHTKIWESFTRYVLSGLLNDITTPKAIVLLGQEAQRLIPHAADPHKIFKYEHPAAASYQGRPWKGDGLFKDVKQFMDFHGRKFNW